MLARLHFDAEMLNLFSFAGSTSLNTMTYCRESPEHGYCTVQYTTCLLLCSCASTYMFIYIYNTIVEIDPVCSHNRNFMNQMASSVLGLCDSVFRPVNASG